MSPALQADSLPLSHLGNSFLLLAWVAYPFSKELPNPEIEPGSHALEADSFSSVQSLSRVRLFVTP